MNIASVNIIFSKGIINSGISSEILCSGCNFRCPYCYRYKLFDNDDNLDIKEVLSKLQYNYDYTKDVLISGGEPTLQNDLYKFLSHLKKYGFKITLETNGSRPDILKKCIPVIDKISMNIKSSIDNYCIFIKDKQELIGIKDRILDSIRIIKDSGLLYEFTVVMCPSFINTYELSNIGKMVDKAKSIVLIRYESLNRYVKNESIDLDLEYTKDDIINIGKIIKGNTYEISIR